MKHIWLKRNTKANGLIEKYKNLKGLVALHCNQTQGIPGP